MRIRAQLEAESSRWARKKQAIFMEKRATLIFRMEIKGTKEEAGSLRRLICPGRKDKATVQFEQLNED